MSNVRSDEESAMTGAPLVTVTTTPADVVPLGDDAAPLADEAAPLGTGGVPFEGDVPPPPQPAMRPAATNTVAFKALVRILVSLSNNTNQCWYAKQRIPKDQPYGGQP